ncbi:MAG: aldolase/citrate lyase family protein [Pseudomonadota bacterium]
MRSNHVLQSWRAGGQTIGAWMSIDSSYSVETLAHAGFDWLCLDMQHGMLDYNIVKHQLTAISSSPAMPFVRVPWNEPYEIMKVLDAGAYGVIVPLVNNREEAVRAVEACRYPPDGIRSYGPNRATLYAGKGYTIAANNEIACIVMIETKEALDNLEDIVSTPGVDAVYIGPNDLAYGLGLSPAGDNDDPIHVEAVSRILETAKRHGVAAGIQTGSVEFTRRYLDQGFHMVTLGSDRGWMERLARKELREVRADSGVNQVEPDKNFY